MKMMMMDLQVIRVRHLNFSTTFLFRFFYVTKVEVLCFIEGEMLYFALFVICFSSPLIWFSSFSSTSEMSSPGFHLIA